jgi:hypothetical protein
MRDEAQEAVELILVLCTHLKKTNLRNTEHIVVIQRIELMMKLIMTSLLFERAFGIDKEESAFEGLWDYISYLEADSSELHSTSQQ